VWVGAQVDHTPKRNQNAESNGKAAQPKATTNHRDPSHIGVMNL